MPDMVSTEFKQDQFDSIYPKGIENHYWTLARNKIIKRELAKKKLANKVVLEVGCGKGIVVNFLRQSGVNCYGVDLAKVEPVNEAREYVYTGIGFESLDKSLISSTEVVMLLDVIEHIEDEAGFLLKIKNFFPNLHCILVTVPAGSKLFSNYDTYNGHYRRYNFSTLSALEKKINMRMSDFSYFFHLLYLPARLLSAFSIKREIRISPPRGSMIFIHKVLAYFFVLDYLLLPKKKLGTSAICYFYD